MMTATTIEPGVEVPTRPGIYRGLPFETYLAIEAVSRSQLLRLFHSPAAFKHAEAQPETLAMKGGTYTHMSILTPALFEREVVVMPNFHGSMKDDEAAKAKGFAGGKDAKIKWLTEHRCLWIPGKDGKPGFVRRDKGCQFQVIDGVVRDEALGISRAVHACEGAATLLHGSVDDSEVTLVWRDEETGILCKARLDRFFENNRGGYTIADLKKTKSVRPGDFAREVGRLHLHVQDAFYTMGAQALIGGVEPDPVFGDGWAFAFVCFEGAPPYFPAVFQLAGGDREMGRREVRRMLDTVAWCEREGHWPDYADRTQVVSLPAYYDEFSLPEGYREEPLT